MGILVKLKILLLKHKLHLKHYNNFHPYYFRSMKFAILTVFCILSAAAVIGCPTDSVEDVRSTTRGKIISSSSNSRILPGKSENAQWIWIKECPACKNFYNEVQYLNCIDTSLNCVSFEVKKFGPNMRFELLEVNDLVKLQKQDTITIDNSSLRKGTAGRSKYQNGVYRGNLTYKDEIGRSRRIKYLSVTDFANQCVLFKIKYIRKNNQDRAILIEAASNCP
jgi:hypothetical protein